MSSHSDNDTMPKDNAKTLVTGIHAFPKPPVRTVAMDLQEAMGETLYPTPLPIDYEKVKLDLQEAMEDFLYPPPPVVEKQTAVHLPPFRYIAPPVDDDANNDADDEADDEADDDLFASSREASPLEVNTSTKTTKKTLSARHMHCHGKRGHARNLAACPRRKQIEQQERSKSLVGRTAGDEDYEPITGLTPDEDELEYFTGKNIVLSSSSDEESGLVNRAVRRLSGWW